MVKIPESDDQAGGADEEVVREIFAKSGADLAKASPQHREMTIKRARHQTGLADFIIFLVRTGKTALGMLGLLFRSGERPGTREE